MTIWEEDSHDFHLESGYPELQTSFEKFSAIVAAGGLE